MPNLNVNLSDTAQRNVLIVVRDMESRPPNYTTDLGAEATTAARELAMELYRELAKRVWVDELEEELGL